MEVIISFIEFYLYDFFAYWKIHLSVEMFGSKSITMRAVTFIRNAMPSVVTTVLNITNVSIWLYFMICACYFFLNIYQLLCIGWWFTVSDDKITRFVVSLELMTWDFFKTLFWTNLLSKRDQRNRSIFKTDQS